MLPSVWVALVAAIARLAAVSSLVIVPVALAVVRVAPLVGLERVTAKVSFCSTVVSPCTFTVITLLVCPAAKLTVPLGRVLFAKSVALAGLVPLPVTAQLAVLAPLVLPERVTVKVKALLPVLPSVWVALVAAIARLAAGVLLVPINNDQPPAMVPVSPPTSSMT